MGDDAGVRIRGVLVALSAVAVVVTSAPVAAAAPVADPLPNRVLGKDWTVLPIKRKAVALTIDCGGNAAGLRSILATLKAEQVPATFFLTGNWVKTYPSKTKTLARRGFTLGNHTQTHPRVSALSDARLRQELTSTSDAVADLTGVDLKPYFRFPYGARRLPLDVNRVNALGYIPFSWTVDTIGWMGTSGGQSAGSVTRRVLAGATPGEIVLMHCGSNPQDGSTLDADAMPAIIKGLRAKGYGFTTVDALLDPKNAPYAP